jgi:hypothetical protein
LKPLFLTAQLDPARLIGRRRLVEFEMRAFVIDFGTVSSNPLHIDCRVGRAPSASAYAIVSMWP